MLHWRKCQPISLYEEKWGGILLIVNFEAINDNAELLQRMGLPW